MVGKKGYPRRHGRIRDSHLAAVVRLHRGLRVTGHARCSMATGALRNRREAGERRHRRPQYHIGEQYEREFSAHLHGSHVSV